MERLRSTMEQFDIDQWGVCAFADVLPLFEVRSRSRIPANAQTVIVILFGYYTFEYPERNISRYAIVDDYHTVVGNLLSQMAEELQKMYNPFQFIPFVDASPINEVLAAVRAGLGEVGMNGQLLNEIYGSRCFIGEIVTDMPVEIPEVADHKICTRCGRCVAACPTKALLSDGFDKNICRSFLTQKKGELTEWEQLQIADGGFVWGCDRCTDACPVNRNAKAAQLEAFYRDNCPVVEEDKIQALCRTKAYGWRGEKVLLRNLRIIKGNVL